MFSSSAATTTATWFSNARRRSVSLFFKPTSPSHKGNTIPLKDFSSVSAVDSSLDLDLDLGAPITILADDEKVERRGFFRVD